MGISLGSKSGANQPMSEINVTPFVDVMLVLLVIFMVTAPMMVQGLDVALPEVDTAVVSGAEEKITLTLMPNKKVFIGSREVEFFKLGKLLKANEKLKKDKEILLHADKSLPYGFVVEVMAIVKAAGALNIGMVTGPVKSETRKTRKSKRKRN